MPEDRFGDLGSGERRSAAERFEEEDRLRPEPDVAPTRPEVPRSGNKYAWAVGIVMLMGIGVLLLTTALPNTGAGLRGPAKGEVVPDFAAPLATGDVSCDDDDDDCAANVCQRADECSEQAGSRPACQLRSESIFNVCEARERPMVLTFLVTEGADCEPQVDRVERMRAEFPGVSFAAVVSGEGRGKSSGSLAAGAGACRWPWTATERFRTSTASVSVPPPCSLTRAEGCAPQSSAT